MSEWQSIDTAPKDSTEIWLGVGNADTRRQRVTVGFWSRNGWRHSHDDETVVWKPTHWQPYFVPTPPPHDLADDAPKLPGHNETMAGLSSLSIRK